MYLDYLSQKIDSNCRQFSFHESILNKPSQNACLSNPRISQKNYFAIRHLVNRFKVVNALLSNPNLIISVVCLKRFYCVGRFNFVLKLKISLKGNMNLVCSVPRWCCMTKKLWQRWLIFHWLNYWWFKCELVVRLKNGWIDRN